jgi:murein DD-endopeptidase MepM/ murein hydrolase activator NlpD
MKDKHKSKNIFSKYFIFSILILGFCNFPLRSDFQQKAKDIKGEINFGKYITTPFKYTVSTCVVETHCGQNLFDSNPNTIWITDREKIDEWVIIDFGAKRLMTSVEVEFSFYTGTPYSVQVLQREVWTTIQENTNAERKSKIGLGGIDASMIRILFLKTTDVSLSVSNVKLFFGTKLLNGIEPNLTGYIIPVENGLIPTDESSLPGAPRKYRNGVHKGLDISYREGLLGITMKVDKDSKIFSANDGEIIRIDHNYNAMTESEFKELSTYNQTHTVTYVDRDFGGRQIWIDHKNGVVTTYNHLDAIAPNLKLGTLVKKGTLIGYAGNSGLLGEAKNNNDAVHLHFEIWIEGEFLGKDVSATQMKKLLGYFFAN